jgi:hypothetical protein
MKKNWGKYDYKSSFWDVVATFFLNLYAIIAAIFIGIFKLIGKFFSDVLKSFYGKFVGGC